MFDLYLPTPESPGAFFALTRRVLLSDKEAKRKRKSGLLLQTSAHREPGDQPGYAWHQLADAGFTSHDLQRVQDAMIDARRSLTVAGIPRLVEREDSRSLVYYGHEIFRFDKTTGFIHSTSWFRGAYVKAKEVSDYRNMLARHGFLSAVEHELGLSTSDVEVQSCEHVMHVTHRTRRGTRAQVRNPKLPPALAIPFGLQAFLEHKLFSRELFKLRAAHFTSVLRNQMLCPEAVRLVGKSSSSGARFQLKEYNQVVVFRELYAAIDAETPQLLPLLHLFLRHSAEAREYASARCTLRTGPALPADAEALAAIRNQFHGLRRFALSRRALSKTDWKAFLTCGPSTMKALSRHVGDGYGFGTFPGERREAERTAAVQSEGATLVPAQVLWVFETFSFARKLGLDVYRNQRLPRQISSLSTHLPARAEVHRPKLELAQRLFLTELRAQYPTAKTFASALDSSKVMSGYSQVLDWLRGEGYAQGFPTEKSTWGSLHERSHEWHRLAAIRAELELREAAANRDALLRETRKAVANPDGPGWRPWFDEQVLKGVLVRPLHSAELLAQEGIDQHHCVYDYHEDCWEGHTLVFGLSLVAKPTVRSTLELGLEGPVGAEGEGRARARWSAAQHRAACNEDPDSRLEAAVSAVERAVTARYREATPTSVPEEA